MSRTGSISSGMSGVTMNDIPNLPGYRSNISSATISAAYPKQYRVFKENSISSAAEEDVFDHDDEHSLQSYFPGSASEFKDAAMSLASYPNRGKSFNDITGRYALKSQIADRNQSKYALPFTDSKSIPKFIVAETTQGFICRYHAFFFETSPKEPNLPLRTRKVDILYYILDGTIEIIEPKVVNSGSIQGIFLKRHKIPRSGSTTRHNGIVPSTCVTPSIRNGNKVRPSSKNNKRLPPLSSSDINDRLVSSSESMNNQQHPQYQNNQSSSSSSSFITIDDFYAGSEITIYQRKYIIADCDEATKEYYSSSLQRSFGEPINNIPNLDYEFCYSDSKPGAVDYLSNHNWNQSRGSTASSNGSISRLTTADSTRQANNHSRLSTSQQASYLTPESKSFYEYDKMILRFYGVWDNRKQLYGDKINVQVHYYLADNTFEVVTLKERNSGRDDIGTILKRTKIMKPIQSLYDEMDRPMTSSSSMSIVSSGSIVDIGYSNNPIGATPYHWRDLTIGQRLQIASVDILLTDADKFTREFYYSKNQRLPKAIHIPSETEEVISNEIHNNSNNHGSSNDNNSITSASSLMHNKRADYLCMNINGQYKPREGDPYALPPKGSLIAEAPFKDGAKLKELQGIILRYTAVMKDPSMTDMNRKFIILFHCEDDAVEIKEVTVRNSGHIGGHFATRSKIENKFTGRFLCPSDLFLDSEVCINGVVFKIIGSDDMTLHYMENNYKTIWPSCDLQHVMKKIQSKQDILIKLILLTKGVNQLVVDYDYIEGLCNMAGLGKSHNNSNNVINKQEICTLCRAVDTTSNKTVKLTKLLKFIMDYKYEDWAMT